MLCHDGAHNVYKSKVSHFSKKISIWGKQTTWGKSDLQFCYPISRDDLQGFFKTFYHDETQSLH